MTFPHTRSSPGWSSAACTCWARWTTASCEQQSRGRPIRQACSWKLVSSTSSSRDVEREPGALPLLSHALRSAWERREGQTLTVAGYRESGGIRGAVAQSAEEIYEQTPAEQRRILRDLLLRLVAPSAEGELVPAGTQALARHGSGTRAADRAPRRGSARDERRRNGRAGPRGTRPGVAPPARLARRRRRGPADPAPPRDGRRHVGRDGPARQRAVSRGTARSGSRLARPSATRPHAHRADVPRHQSERGRSRAPDRRDPCPASDPCQPTAPHPPDMCRASARRCAGRRRHRAGPTR